jgi:ubiquitin-protein ligase
MQQRGIQRKSLGDSAPELKFRERIARCNVKRSGGTALDKSSSR